MLAAGTRAIPTGNVERLGDVSCWPQVNNGMIIAHMPSPTQLAKSLGVGRRGEDIFLYWWYPTAFMVLMWSMYWTRMGTGHNTRRTFYLRQLRRLS